MLEVTETAMDLFHKSTEALAPDEESNKCIRLKPGRGSGLALTFEEPRDDDRTHTREQRVVLAVPDKIDRMCSGQTLDMDVNGRLTVE